MELSEIVPWGRSFSEYAAMFNLGDSLASSRILGCGDGPASFNAEATQAGWRVISADPIYRFDRAALSARIESVRDEVLRQVRMRSMDYVWTSIKDPDALELTRMTAMKRFLDDYDIGRDQGRYVEASVPDLPFASDAFDLALCSHFLFLYSTQLDAAAHLACVRELCRVAREVRIYPLTALHDNRPSTHLAPLTDALRADGLTTAVIPVGYEFQRGATAMLQIRR